jgi:coenzyme F420-reducing hydrogenase gamma subunit
VFDFTGCEGCELQLANREENLAAFFDAIDIVSFRELSSSDGDEVDIAFVEGSISREDEVERLRDIRDRARVLVALGSCACFGGVSRQKNAIGVERANRVVYGDQPRDTMPVRPIRDVVPVDLEIPGCPVAKDEVERIVQHLVFDVPYSFPVYPVCVDCRQRFTACLMDRGRLCLGSVTRGGCDAPCPAGGLGCWGCRGPAADANLGQLLAEASSRGFSDAEVAERLAFFGGFEDLR